MSFHAGRDATMRSPGCALAHIAPRRKAKKQIAATRTNTLAHRARAGVGAAAKCRNLSGLRTTAGSTPHHHCDALGLGYSSCMATRSAVRIP